jgi:hypothetical protein
LQPAIATLSERNATVPTPFGFPPVAVTVAVNWTDCAYVLGFVAEAKAVDVGRTAAVTVNVVGKTWKPEVQAPAVFLLHTRTVHVPTVETARVTSCVPLVLPFGSENSESWAGVPVAGSTPGAYH